jgi:drug/metabolite transporter (DMT)-like permease
MVARYAKFGVALVAVVVSFLVARFVGHTPIDNTEWANVVLAATGAASVYIGPNVTSAPITKFGLALAAAVFTAVNNLVSTGVAMPEWWQLVVMAAGAIGVYAIPNGASTTPTPTHAA